MEKTDDKFPIKPQCRAGNEKADWVVFTEHTLGDFFFCDRGDYIWSVFGAHPIHV